MATATLRALATEWGKAGEAEIDQLTNQSGFLRVAQAIKSSHGATHKYKMLDELPTFSVVSPGGSSGDTTTNENVLSVDLKIIRANESEPADILEDYPGGSAAFFNKQRPAYLESFGQTASKVMFYGNNSTFGDVSWGAGLHQIAKAYGNQIDAGGTSASTTTIFAVRFRAGDNGCGVLYDSNVTGAGEIMKSEVLNGGKKVLEVTNTTGNLKKLSVQVSHYGKLAFHSASSYDVARLHSIQDDTNDRPTAKEIDELLDMVRADGNTFLFMSRLGRRMVQVLDASALSTTPGTTDFYSWLNSWNGIPMIIDDNISDVETDVLD